MNKVLLQVFLIASLLLVSNVHAFAEEDKPPKIKTETVQLKVNEEVSIDKARLVIHLVRIVEDQRCPANVACGWSGYVKIEIIANVNNIDYGHHFISNINNEFRNLSSEIILDKYTIKLGFGGVLPERDHQGSKNGIAEITPQEYEVELVIDQ